MSNYSREVEVPEYRPEGISAGAARMAAVSPYDSALSALIVPYNNAEVMSVSPAHVAQEFEGESCPELKALYKLRRPDIARAS
jgi:hypothetical protein